MNLSTKKLCFVIIAAAVVLSGCTKPERPDPRSTMIGPTGGGPGGLYGGNINIDGGSPPDLELRDSTDFATGGDRTILSPVYFDFDQSGIKASERAKLDAAKSYLDSNPGARLLLEGHCDWKGTAEYNLGLGDRRASSAKQYLVTSGVPADKLEVLSKGDLEAVENADPDTQAKDRRVDLVVFQQ